MLNYRVFMDLFPLHSFFGINCQAFVYKVLCIGTDVHPFIGRTTIFYAFDQGIVVGGEIWVFSIDHLIKYDAY